jgi:hypothetical protein
MNYLCYVIFSMFAFYLCFGIIRYEVYTSVKYTTPKICTICWSTRWCILYHLGFGKKRKKLVVQKPEKVEKLVV